MPRTDWSEQVNMFAGYLVFGPIYLGTAQHEAAWRDQANSLVALESGFGDYSEPWQASATPIMPTVVIPLRAKTLDEPIRVPKTTEINTIPTIDYVNWSDGTSSTIFYGAADPLQTTLAGTMWTPTHTVTDQYGVRYDQVIPTATPVQDYAIPPVVIPFNGQHRHPDFPMVLPDLTGCTYGDLIWMYLEGRFVRTSPSAYQRVDPMQYIDPFGNVYPNPVISQFTCTRVPGNISYETISLQMWLET